MDDSLINIISGLLLIIGLVGSVLPVLPGAPLALIGLLLFKFSSSCDYGWWVIALCGVFVIIGSLLDYILPVALTKKMGGSKYGVWGAVVGMIIGLFFMPFGIIVGPFLGAFAGEMLYERDHKIAFKAATGSFISFILTTGYDVILTLIFIAIFITQFF